MIDPAGETIRPDHDGDSEPAALPPIDLSDDERAELRTLDALGSGGTAEVLRARQRALRRDVAVKLPHLVDASAASFVREAWVTGWLEHPNIPPVYQLGSDAAGRPALVMKRIEGRTWSALLHERAADARCAPAELDRQLAILMEVAQAVSFAHSRGILHRDLKPTNIMIGSFGELLVLDWGIAVAIDAEAGKRALPAAAARALAGTPAYMAPEMAECQSERFGPATDVYLLGAILHEIVTGTPPHDGATVSDALAQAVRAEPPELPALVPAELAAICRRALARDPADRYPTAALLRRAIEEFRSHQQSLALTDQADRELAALQASRGAVAAHDLFVRCRFAYGEALRTWAANGRARAGLEQSLLAMATRHLDDGEPQPALALLDEMQAPPAELVARARAALAQRADVGRELVKLRSVAHEVDLDLARRARAKVLLGVGLVWGLATLVTGLMVHAGRLELNYPQREQAAALTTLIVTGVFLWQRRALAVNQVNRRFLAGAFMLAGCDLVTAVISHALDMPIAHALVMEMCFVLVVLVAMAAFVEARLGWAALAFAPFLVPATLRPEHVMLCLAGGILASFITMAALTARSSAPPRPD